MDGKPKGSKAAPAAKAANPAQALISKNIQLALEIQEGQRALKLNARVEKAKEDIVKLMERETVRVYRNIMKSREAVNKNMRVAETEKAYEQSPNEDQRGSDESQDHPAHQGRKGTQTYGGSLGSRITIISPSDVP
jgi:hypothetical protein